jgi:hypothetical protein
VPQSSGRPAAEFATRNQTIATETESSDATTVSIVQSTLHVQLVVVVSPICLAYHVAPLCKHPTMSW